MFIVTQKQKSPKNVLYFFTAKHKSLKKIIFYYWFNLAYPSPLNKKSKNFFIVTKKIEISKKFRNL